MTLSYYVRNALRYAAIIFLSVIAGIAGSLVMPFPNMVAFFTMPVVTAIVAMILDHKLPETQA